MNMATALREPVRAAAAAAPRNDHAPMNEAWDGPLPTRYVVREIDFNMIDGDLQFSFRNHDLAEDLPAGGVDDIIAGLLAPPPSAALAPSLFAAAAPHTPLDLDIQTPLFVILTLSEPKNMRFSAQLKGMTHKNSDDSDYYGHLRHVNDAAQSAAPLGACKLIYFIASPPAGAYQHGFNFNVDLDQEPGPGGEPRSLPITIDPDIRHPGGSTT
jgi:hypothetical protein